MPGGRDNRQRTLAGSSQILQRLWTFVMRGIVVGMMMLMSGIGLAMEDEREAILATVRAYAADAAQRRSPCAPYHRFKLCHRLE